MTLDNLRCGDKFRIEKVNIGGEIGKRLVDMGLTHGIEGEMLRCAFFGDPIEIRVRDYCVSLRKSEAAGVDVVITETTDRPFWGKGRRAGRHGRRGGPFWKKRK